MTKTLGQVAYEAHQRAAGFAAHWDANEGQAWQAAAEAVVNHSSRVLNATAIKAAALEGIAEERERTRAVIEAAKARDSFGVALSCLEHAGNCCLGWCDACKYGHAADSALVAAVEALQEVEGE